MEKLRNLRTANIYVAEKLWSLSWRDVFYYSTAESEQIQPTKYRVKKSNNMQNQKSDSGLRGGQIL